MKVLMVCLGNICRSPLAEGILEAKIKEQGMGWQVDSAGTGGWHAGELPDKRSIAVAKKYGIDLSRQRARKIQSSDFEAFDHILAMDASVLAHLHSIAPRYHHPKITLMSKYSGTNPDIDVPDPYYGGLDGFEQVYSQLDEACSGFISANQLREG